MTDLDLSEFESFSRPRFKPCPVKAAMEGLAPEDLRSLEAALDADLNRITNAGISSWFAVREIKVPWQNIASHRRGTCPCGKET